MSRFMPRRCERCGSGILVPIDAIRHYCAPREDALQADASRIAGNASRFPNMRDDLSPLAIDLIRVLYEAGAYSETRDS